MLTKRNSLPTWTFILLTSMVYLMPGKAFSASSNLPTPVSEFTFEHSSDSENQAEIKQTNKPELLVARYRRRRSYRRRYRRCGDYGC